MSDDMKHTLSKQVIASVRALIEGGCTIEWVTLNLNKGGHRLSDGELFRTADVVKIMQQEGLEL